MSRIVCSVLALCLAVGVSAQEDKDVFHEAVGVYVPKHIVNELQNIPSKTITSPIDVLSYSVYLDLYHGLAPMPDSVETPVTYAASADIRLVVLTDTLVAVPLHTDVFTIEFDSAFVNGSRSTFRRQSGRQIITPPFVIRSGDTLSVRIYYHVDRVDGQGLNVVNGREMFEALGSYPSAFTFSEPENSRRWYPCNDIPSDKARFTARARLPIDHRLVSNGELENTVLDGDSAKIETWASPDEMSTYLFVMNASKYKQLFQLYMREDGTGVAIRNFHWDTDEEGLYKAPFAVRNIPEMFKAFEPLYGRYPFRTYGHAAVHPINIGGMEHQTMTTVNRKWLEGNAEVGYAHELGHQWFGDAVTCATWGDIWLNEGGATFSEAVWREHDEGPAGYRDQMMRRRSKYMEQGQDSPPVWDIPIGNLFNDPTTYAKASWIYHMMRRMLGDDVFFATLRKYLTAYHGKSLQTAEFEAFWKREIPNPPISWDIFFDQWLVKRGHPFYWVRMNAVEGNASRLHILVDQMQTNDGVPRVFHAPITIRFRSQGNVVAEHSFIMKERAADFTIDVSDVIDSVEFDPNMDVLHQVRADVAVSVEENDGRTGIDCANCPTMRIVGHPYVTHGNEIVVGLHNVQSSARLALIDLRGIEVWSTDVMPSQNVVNINSAQLSAGAYVATLTSQSGVTTTRIIVL